MHEPEPTDVEAARCAKTTKPLSNEESKPTGPERYVYLFRRWVGFHVTRREVSEVAFLSRIVRDNAAVRYAD